MFYTESPLVILSKMNNHFSGRLAIQKGEFACLPTLKVQSESLEIFVVQKVHKNFFKYIITVCGWINKQS